MNCISVQQQQLPVSEANSATETDDHNDDDVTTSNCCNNNNKSYSNNSNIIHNTFMNKRKNSCSSKYSSMNITSISIFIIIITITFQQYIALLYNNNKSCTINVLLPVIAWTTTRTRSYIGGSGSATHWNRMRQQLPVVSLLLSSPPPSLLLLSSSALFLSSSSPIDEAEYYKNQAEKLRNEINIMEQEKRMIQKDIDEKEQVLLYEQQQLQDRYSVMVPILKPDGTTILERCTFTPIYTNNNDDMSSSSSSPASYITTIESNLPLGIIIGETTRLDSNSNQTLSYIVIDDILPNSYGEQSGLQINDIIHACTACKVDMELPTWQLLLGGIGRPKTVRYMHSVLGGGSTSSSSNNNVFESTMNAIASNRMDPEQRPIVLVIERREPYL